MISNKMRFFRLFQYLYSQTDVNHKTTKQEISRRLGDKETPYARATVRDDIQTLQDLGFTIETQDKQGTYYWMSQREFTLPELKLLVDAVSASKFISKKQSKDLIAKLTRLCSVHEAEELVRALYMPHKPGNYQSYKLVDEIHRAVREGKKLRFHYYEFTPTKQKVYRHNNQYYKCSPYGLIWDNDHYYMVAWSEDKDTIVNFRVDRMSKAQVLEDEAADPAPEGFDIQRHVDAIFTMYGGQLSDVELLCANELMNVIIDEFGTRVDTQIVDDAHFRVKAQVQLSPTFYAWVFTFGGKMWITGPEAAVEGYRDMVEKADWSCAPPHP